MGSRTFRVLIKLNLKKKKIVFAVQDFKLIVFHLLIAIMLPSLGRFYSEQRKGEERRQDGQGGMKWGKEAKFGRE